METPTIRYNLKDRGRKHMGQERNFNIKAICDAINSPACQENVSMRGLVGYYGHMPRIRYGMNPVEGVMDGGKYVPVEPAFVTTYLKADYEGNVEHRAEFLDTAAGKLAQKLFDSKMGGFSSAIDASKPAFHGFDFVLQPNYVNNSFRGVVLDDIDAVAAMTYDNVFAAEQSEQTQSMIVLLDSINSERTTTAETIEHLQQENEQLLSMLSQKGIDPAVALDSACVMPVAVSVDAAERIQRDRKSFRTAHLPGVVAPSEAQPEDPVYVRLMDKFLGGRRA